MSVRSGFFNSLNHDRRYDANTVGELFDGMIVDGVYSSIGDKFIVKADTGMRVMVGSGRAWFHHTWTVNDTDLPIYLEESAQVLPRIDLVVLEINNNEDVRKNDIKVLKGVPASTPVRPELIKSLYLNQYPLCEIFVDADVQEITQGKITNLVGTDECPFATALLEHVTTNELILQWKAQWAEYVEKAQKDTEAWTEAFEYRLSNWVAGLRDILDDNAAGHIQNEIDALAEMVSVIEYLDENDKTIVKASRNYKYGDSLIINYGDPIHPRLYFAVADIAIGDLIEPGTNVVADSVMQRIKKMHETNHFMIHDWKWSLYTVEKWGMNLHEYELRYQENYLPAGHVGNIRSCGATIDSPASEVEMEYFGELVDKCTVDTENKIVKLYSTQRLNNFYICIDGIKGDVDASIIYDVSTLSGIKEIVKDGRHHQLLSVGDTINITITGTNGEVNRAWGTTDDTLNLSFVIVAIDHDPEYPNQVILATSDLITAVKRFHSVNDNQVKWYDPDDLENSSELGILLNTNGFYDLLPYSDQQAISEREFYRSEGGANTTTLRKEKAKIWLPRIKEVVGVQSNGSLTEADTAEQFAYYADTAYDVVSPHRTKTSLWQTISPALANGTQVVAMNSNGTVYGNDNLNTARYVAPHFHITGD